MKESMTKTRKHENCNCFLFVVICHAMVDGWLLDVNKRKVYNLEQLIREICGVDDLEEKPKVVLVEEYESGRWQKYFYCGLKNLLTIVKVDVFRKKG